MAINKSNISNSAIRIFLQKVGEFYDNSRGFDKFIPNKSQKTKLLKNFDYRCCYCGKEIDEKNLTLDHLIPLNKDSLGLHAWGNVVPCCKDCNSEKHQKQWEEFLKTKSGGENFAKRKKSIMEFVEKNNYDPSLDLTKTAGNLYEDVGAVAMTLIYLRYEQAQDLIKNFKK